MFDEPFHHVRIVGRVERLDRQPEMVPNDLVGRAVHPWNLGPQAAPELGKAPEEARQPGHAGFDEHDLQAGMLGEHALADQARHLRLEALRLRRVILDVIGRPAERRHRVAVGRTGMDADRQSVALGRGIDRPEVPPSKRHLLHRQDQHLDEAPVLGAALDLVHRVFGVLHRHDDGGAQPRIAVEPFPGDPVVERAREGRRHVLREQELDAIEAIADRQARLPAVEHLLR